ncbi:MAG: ribonuclease HII [Candidatus Pacebacteria bacterium]|nr:ribonuclease HII [Candidatus Paceibacterota bacterium]
MKGKFIIGIDEVGRGALAGPVVVGAVAILDSNKKECFRILKDSKKLSEKQREKWFDFIKREPKIFFKTARVNPKGVDRINVTQAANLAAWRSVFELVRRIGEKNVKSIILDGGLFIKNKEFQAKTFKKIDKKTLIKADEKFKEVMLASIAAKVVRDRYMQKIHKKFPEYGFNRHVGYGTKLHKEKIKLCGLSLAHRRSFCKFLA